jgi:hypothetical protein
MPNLLLILDSLEPDLLKEALSKPRYGKIMSLRFKILRQEPLSDLSII